VSFSPRFISLFRSRWTNTSHRILDFCPYDLFLFVDLTCFSFSLMLPRLAFVLAFILFDFLLRFNVNNEENRSFVRHVSLETLKTDNSRSLSSSLFMLFNCIVFTRLFNMIICVRHASFTHVNAYSFSIFVSRRNMFSTVVLSIDFIRSMSNVP
jgi:hypothetical protein